MASRLRLALGILGLISLFIIPTASVLVNQDVIGPREEVVLRPYDGPNGKYAHINSSRHLTVNITTTGVNQEATTEIDRIFVIENAGNDTKQVWVTHPRTDVLTFYDAETGDSLSRNVTLGPNERVVASLRIDTTDQSTHVGERLTIPIYIHVRSENLVPRADAGGPYSIREDGTITLSGSSSADPDGRITRYEWTILRGPGRLTNATTVNPTYRSPSNLQRNRTVTVELTVTDEAGDTGTDTATITVFGNQPPNPSAGGPYVVKAGGTIRLNGTESTDPDGQITSYEWQLAGTNAGSLSNRRTANPRYTAPRLPERTTNRTVTARLTVTDNAGKTVRTTVPITVIPNTPPTAVAGGPYEVVGGTPLRLDGRNSTDPDGTITAFNWTILTGPGSLSASTTARPSYTPPADGRIDANVTIRLSVTDDTGTTGRDTTSIRLRRSAVSVVGPSSVDFGEVFIGSTARRAITLRNNGSAAVRLNASRIAGEGSFQIRLVDDDLPATLNPGDSLSLTVAYEPTTPGRLRAGLQVNSTTSGQPSLSIPLTGTGIAPNITVQPTPITFRETGRGLTSTRRVTVENRGTGPIVVNETVIEGSMAGMFAIEDSPQHPFTLGVNESRTLTVSFTPTEAGVLSSTLVFRTNDPTRRNVTARLQGTGLPPRLDLDKDHLDFGNVTVGTSKTLTLTITNDGNPASDLHVRSTDIVSGHTNVFQIVGGDAPFTLSPNESRELQITYSPSSPGIKTAQLRIISDARRRQIDVWMSNTGWRIAVQDLPRGSRGMDSNEETWSPPETRDTSSAAELDANNIPAGLKIGVNVSVPSTRENPVTVQNATVSPVIEAGSNATFDIYFLHDRENPPTREGVTFTTSSGRAVTSYISVEHTIPNEQLSDTAFAYRVKKHNLPDDIQPSDVLIRHRTGNQWHRLESKLIKETRSSYIYRVKTDGFSQFVVTNPVGFTVDAGDDVTTNPGTTLRLEGSVGSVPKGSISSYRWEITKGPGSLTGASTATPTYRAPSSVNAETTATIRLSVTNNAGTRATDTVNVTIRAPARSPRQTPGGGTAPSNGQESPQTPAPSGTEQTVENDGVSVTLPTGGEQTPLSELISIEDVGVPERSREGPKAVIAPGDPSESSNVVEANGSTANLTTTINASTTGRELDLKGADAITLVKRPITLVGTHSLFSSKESIANRWRMIKRLNITVPRGYENQSATLRITVDRSQFGGTDPAEATIARKHGGWQLLETEVVETTPTVVVLQARTPGFSTFAVFGNNEVSYSWEVETYDEPLTGPRITPEFDDVGFYNVSLTVTDAYGLTDTAGYVILANDRPAVDIEVPANVTANETTTLRANVTDEMGNITEVSWTLPDGSRASGQRTNYSFPPGEHFVEVAVTDEFGETNETSVRILVGEETQRGPAAQVVDLTRRIDSPVALVILLIPVVLAVIVLYRRFAPLIVILMDRGHVPDIIDLESPRVDTANDRIVIEWFGVIDYGDDLETINIVVSDESGNELVEKRIEVGGRPRYVGEPEIISMPGDLNPSSLRGYTIRVTAVDADGRRSTQSYVEGRRSRWRDLSLRGLLPGRSG